MFSGLVEREAGMEVLVCSLVVSLFFDIYGLDKLSDWNDEDGYEKLTEFYKMFLKKPTIKFCEKIWTRSLSKILIQHLKL